MMKVGLCKLCLLEKPLLKKSHIIPDFMYQNVKEEGGRMNVFAPAAIFRGEEGKPRYAPTGVYDPDILCLECDREIIGQYDDYAGKIIYASEGQLSERLAPRPKYFITEEGQKFSFTSNVDYKKFKLFLLSVLWRASISRHKFFSLVNLGADEEVIREMIYNGNAKTFFDYPTAFMWYGRAESDSVLA